MPRRWQKRSGARVVAIETSLTPPWALESAQELFWMGAFFMVRLALRRKAGIWVSTTTDRFAIAGNEAASKRWQRVPRSPAEHVRNLRRVRIPSFGKWRAAIFKAREAHWGGEVSAPITPSPEKAYAINVAALAVGAVE